MALYAGAESCLTVVRALRVRRRLVYQADLPAEYLARRGRYAGGAIVEGVALLLPWPPDSNLTIAALLAVSGLVVHVNRRYVWTPRKM